uniref:NADH-ubiquinone oxidoreductase chain 4 n=1 Tax=Blattisocius keegani TaxID=2337216 RepID=A0A4Y5QDF5_9ACAR|nr:NADH dehydrogenase subunit 4 [Blattisocius keegani]
MMFYNLILMVVLFLLYCCNNKLMIMFTMFVMMGIQMSMIGNLIMVEEFMSFGMYLDGMTLMLNWLTCWVMLMLKTMVDYKSFLNYTLMVFLMLCFMSSNLLMMYIWFEAILIPMFIKILTEGAGMKRVMSSLYLMVFTFFGSFLMIVIMLLGFNNNYSFMYQNLMLSNLNWNSVWMLMFLMFFIKMPVYSVHMWLPYAHVEASIEGSVILAGLILKLGGFGLLRVNNYVILSLFMKGAVMVLSLWGAFVVSLICMRQVDLKKLIAYSSIVHMGWLSSVLMEDSIMGVNSGLGVMISHGLVSGGLFIFIGVVYYRVYSRNLLLMKGFSMKMGGLNWVFLVMILMNMGTPPFMNFFVEMIIILLMVKISVLMIFLICSLMILSISYNLYVYMNMCSVKMSQNVRDDVLEMGENLVFLLILFPVILYLFKMNLFLEWMWYLTSLWKMLNCEFKEKKVLLNYFYFISMNIYIFKYYIIIFNLCIYSKVFNFCFSD